MSFYSINVRKFALFVCVLFGFTSSFAQESRVKQEILDYKDSIAEIITKGRHLVYDKLLLGDIEKVKKINDVLFQEVNLTDHLVYTPLEYWMILYWVGDYKEVIRSELGYHNAVNSEHNMIRPDYDILSKNITTITQDKKLDILRQIASSPISDTDKYFLELNLDFLITGNHRIAGVTDSLNQKATNFLNRFPGSRFEYFVRHYIRFQFAQSKFGIDFEFFTGYGRFTSNLAKQFSGVVPYGVAFGFQYSNFILYLRDCFGAGKSLVDMPYSKGVWPKNSRMQMFLPEATLGYVCKESKRLKLAPFAGIGGMTLGPPSGKSAQNSDLEGAGLDWTTAYIFGLNADIKLSKKKFANENQKGSAGYGFIRIRYSLNLPQFENRYNAFGGVYHGVTVGFGGFARSIKRKY
jgi:hypothetical protein